MGLKIFVNLLLVGMFLLTVSCSSTTKISSSDREARIYVNGEYLGNGSAVYSDQKIVGSTNTVTIKKKGCRDNNYTFARSEELDVGACIGGVLAFAPFLWIMKYKPIHSYDFECD